MFEQSILDQLRDVFKTLGREVTLVVSRSTHGQQAELVQFLGEVATTSPQIKIVAGDVDSAVPSFSFVADGKPTGLSFTGIPGGHEFTTLIVAILNAGGSGKMPDAGLVKRIQRLKGKLAIRTYVSLSCENCPEVAQALNQIALAHGDISHATIDGAFVQDDLARLNVQGVPAVFVGDDLIHSGRSNLADLIGKLEERYASQESADHEQDLGHFDVTIIGGGPAGAAAAIYSVRKGLKTALIAERIGGQMLETKGIENFASVPYTEGTQLSADLDKHLRSYPVVALENRRVAAIEKGAKKTVHIVGGERLTTDAVIVATGAKWRELGVPGEKDYLGRGVAFCPHCDGPYYKGKRVAVVGGGNSGVEAAIDLAGICQHVTLFEFNDRLKADDVLIKKLGTLANVVVITQAKTTAVVGNGETVVAIEYQDRTTSAMKRVELDGIFVQIGLAPNSAFVRDVIATNPFGEIVIDAKGRTSEPGIYAAGDVTTIPYKQIMIAMGEGAKAALTAFEDRMRS